MSSVSNRRKARRKPGASAAAAAACRPPPTAPFFFSPRRSLKGKQPPEGWELIEEVVEDFEQQMKDAVNEDTAGKRRNETTWKVRADPRRCLTRIKMRLEMSTAACADDRRT